MIQELDVGNAEELLNRARSAYQALDLPQALEYYQAAQASQPGSYEAQLGLAQTLTRMRRHKEGIVAAQQCVEMNPDRFEGYAALGTLHFIGDHPGEALSALDRAVQRAPMDPDPHLTLSQVYSDARRFDKASSELEQARSLISGIKDEQRSRALHALAWHVETYQQLLQGRNGEAKESARKVVALEDANPYAACLAYSNLGILEARERHYDQAIEHLGRAYTMNPFFDRAGAALGRLLIIRGEYGRAQEVFRDVLTRTVPQNGDIRYAYGVALAKSGQREEALAQYRLALKEGLPGMNGMLGRWQSVWLSDLGRKAIIALVLVAILVWLIVGQPSPQSLTLVAVLGVIVILQKTVGKRKP